MEDVLSATLIRVRSLNIERNGHTGEFLEVKQAGVFSTKQHRKHSVNHVANLVLVRIGVVLVDSELIVFIRNKFDGI